MLIELSEGIALLLALSLLQGFVRRYFQKNKTVQQIVSGLLFGGICVVGMSSPIELFPGVIFDARSVVLSMAGLFGGPIVGGIAAVIAGGYRAWLGGGGEYVGISVVVVTMSLGLIYRYCRDREWVKVGIPQLLVFGFIVHAIEVLLFTELPIQVVQDVMDNVSLPLILTFTPAVAILGYLLQDIDNRMEIEAALQRSKDQYQSLSRNLQSLVNGANVPIFTLNAQLQIIEWNSAMGRITGFQKEDVFYCNFVNEIVAENSRRFLIPILKKTLLGIDTPVFEILLPRRSGKQAVLLLSASPQYDEKRAIIGIICAGQEITSLKEAEASLRQSQKMKAVGQLTGGIAHDFNNIIGIVMGNLELLKDAVADDEDATKRVESALKGALRGASLTRKLLGFAAAGSQRIELTQVNEFISNMEELIVKSLTVSIQIENHLADDLWPVNINPGELEDTILNLALNARDAMPDGGKLTISTSNKILDADYVQYNPLGEEGEFVMISVEDTGVGMTKEDREKAFEPFFTTKEEGKGTGLGLSMVYGFVQRSGGHVKIYSEVGEGTTVRIYLPRAEHDAPGAVSPSQQQKYLPRGMETILVVDDEEPLVEIATTNLESLGYKVVAATDGHQALKILDGNRDIDLLFSDIVMPGALNGFQLAIAGLNFRPSLKILLTTGFMKAKEDYADMDGNKHTKLAHNVLRKPYNQVELATAIRNTLDEED